MVAVAVAVGVAVGGAVIVVVAASVTVKAAVGTRLAVGVAVAVGGLVGEAIWLISLEEVGCDGAVQLGNRRTAVTTKQHNVS